jgi:hypothetical protein
MAMWPLWTLFDAKRIYTEREINTVLRSAHAFGDHVTLRRELVNHKLLARKADCSAYWKVPARPTTKCGRCCRRGVRAARGAVPPRCREDDRGRLTVRPSRRRPAWPATRGWHMLRRAGREPLPARPRWIDRPLARPRAEPP